MTTGAPNTAVTVLIFNSVGAKIVLAKRSESRQKMAPPKNIAGMIITGFDVLNIFFIRCGTAIPTNETGPAKAVTQADNILDKRIIITLNLATLTPMLFA